MTWSINLLSFVYFVENYCVTIMLVAFALDLSFQQECSYCHFPNCFQVKAIMCDAGIATQKLRTGLLIGELGKTTLYFIQAASICYVIEA